MGILIFDEPYKHQNQTSNKILGILEQFFWFYSWVGVLGIQCR